MSIRNILKKAAELVVELPPEPIQDYASSPAPRESAPEPAPVVTKSVEQIVRETPGPNLDQISVPASPTAGPTAPEGHVEFDAVYRSAGLTPVAFSAEKALEVIQSLPSELPLDVRRATVQATIKAMGAAMGVNTEGVIADAGRKVAALAAYEDMLSHQSDTYVQTLEAKISELETQAAAHRAEIAKTQELLVAAVGMCDAESKRLDDVLEFFTLDQGTSRNAI